MSKKILDGAKIFCDKGSVCSKLKVTSQQIVKTDGKLVGTDMDKAPNVNIQPFGVCSITQKSCVPAPINWIKTHASHVINNQQLLLDSSECLCSVGGKIKPLHVNYNGFAKHE